MGTVRRLIERVGFPLVLLAGAATAAGAVWDVRALWIGGLLGLAIVAVTLAIRATRGTFGPPAAARPTTKPDEAMRADEV